MPVPSAWTVNSVFDSSSTAATSFEFITGRNWRYAWDYTHTVSIFVCTSKCSLFCSSKFKTNILFWWVFSNVFLNLLVYTQALVCIFSIRCLFTFYLFELMRQSWGKAQCYSKGCGVVSIVFEHLYFLSVFKCIHSAEHIWNALFSLDKKQPLSVDRRPKHR